MDKLPLPGTSPFHMRGSSYARMREHIDRRVPGGIDAVLARLPDADLRAFSRQVFLPVAWYDAMPVLPLTEAMTRVTGEDYAEAVRSRARTVAERDATGLYKLLLRVVTPGLVADRLQRASLRYFDFGRVEVLSAAGKRAEVRLTGMPRPLLKWFMPMTDGYASTLLGMAGAGAPRVWYGAPVRDGERMGIETVTVAFHLAWR